MDAEKIVASFEKVPVYINKLIYKLADLKKIKDNQPHSSDIEDEIAFIEFKCAILRDNFDIILGFLEFNMELLQSHFKEIDDLFE